MKKSKSHILPKIKYDISEPYEDLLHWNLSWSFTFNREVRGAAPHLAPEQLLFPF